MITSDMDEQPSPSTSSLIQRRTSNMEADLEHPRPSPQPISTQPSRKARHSIAQSHVKPLPTPGKSATAIPQNLLPSAPASPPTPAPSPTPHQRAPSWTSAGENEDTFLRDSRAHFSVLNKAERQRFLAEILNMCDSQSLSFVHQFVGPRLKKDPVIFLPIELSLRVSISFSHNQIIIRSPI